MRATYRIHELNREKFEREMARLARKATKLGMQPPTFRVLGCEHEKGQDNLYHRYLVVEVEGEAPRVAGWRFVATIQHGGPRNVIRAVPGLEDTIPEEWWEAPRKCDHCGTNRLRRDTYLLTNDRGEWKQVGRSCLQDFLGGTDPHAVAKYLHDLHGMASAAEEDWERAPAGGCYYIKLDEYLEIVLQLIRTYGWVSRSRAEATRERSTADLALGRYYGEWRAQQLKLESLTEQDKRLVQEALAWVRSLEPASSYERNLQAACLDDYTDMRNAGLVASPLVAYRRDLADREPPAQAPYIGDEGQRLDVEVKVQRILRIGSLQSLYGPTYLHLRGSGGPAGGLVRQQ